MYLYKATGKHGSTWQHWPSPVQRPPITNSPPERPNPSKHEISALLPSFEDAYACALALCFWSDGNPV